MPRRFALQPLPADDARLPCPLPLRAAPFPTAAAPQALRLLLPPPAPRRRCGGGGAAAASADGLGALFPGGRGPRPFERREARRHAARRTSPRHGAGRRRAAATPPPRHRERRRAAAGPRGARAAAAPPRRARCRPPLHAGLARGSRSRRAPSRRRAVTPIPQSCGASAGRHARASSISSPRAARRPTTSGRSRCGCAQAAAPRAARVGSGPPRRRALGGRCVGRAPTEAARADARLRVPRSTARAGRRRKHRAGGARDAPLRAQPQLRACAAAPPPPPPPPLAGRDGMVRVPTGLAGLEPVRSRAAAPRAWPRPALGHRARPTACGWGAPSSVCVRVLRGVRCYRYVIGYSGDTGSPGPRFELRLLERMAGREAEPTVHVLHSSPEFFAAPYSYDAATGGSPTNYSPPVDVDERLELWLRRARWRSCSCASPTKAQHAPAGRSLPAGEPRTCSTLLFGEGGVTRARPRRPMAQPIASGGGVQSAAIAFLTGAVPTLACPRPSCAGGPRE